MAIVGALGTCAGGGLVVPADNSARMEQLWSEPRDLAKRDLFHGSGGAALAPRPDAVYALEKRDTAGFSITFDLEDDGGQEWSVKIGPEAQTEIVASRIVWAMGYRQPPSYYVRKWTYKGAETAPVHGRFRPKLPWLKSIAEWDWNRNPFVGTQPLKGLKVLMMVLNNTDLKPQQNTVYEVTDDSPIDRWFVVKDLGATLGETGAVNPRRGWIDGFEKHGFIREVEENGRVKFEFHGLRGSMFDDVTVADVRWMCTYLDRLSDRQWRDAFRAGGYDEPVTARYIARIKEKIRQGLSLPDTHQ